MAKFKLLSGRHSMEMEDGSTHTFNQGDVIETDSNLCAKFNGVGVPGKFEQVADNAKCSKPLRVLPPMNGTDVPKMAAKAEPYKEPAPDNAGPGKALSDKVIMTPEIPKGTDKPSFPTDGVPGTPVQGNDDDEDDGDDATDTYESMTVAELKAHAQEEEIDLKGAVSKADIIKRLRSAR